MRTACSLLTPATTTRADDGSNAGAAGGGVGDGGESVGAVGGAAVDDATGGEEVGTTAGGRGSAATATATGDTTARADVEASGAPFLMPSARRAEAIDDGAFEVGAGLARSASPSTEGEGLSSPRARVEVASSVASADARPLARALSRSVPRVSASPPSTRTASATANTPRLRAHASCVAPRAVTTTVGEPRSLASDAGIELARGASTST